MKSLEEIREYRDALRALAAKPCGCSARGHSNACEQGRWGMRAVANALSWVLGDGELPAQQALVDEMLRSAGRFKRGPAAG